MWCCGNKVGSRITLLSKNSKYTALIWQKLTKTANHPKGNRHLEKNVTLYDNNISLCTVESSDPELWDLNIKHSEGVILVIEAEDLRTPEVQNFIQEISKQNLLVLCNTQNIGDTAVEESTDEHVKYIVCDIEGWKGLDSGLSWLSNSISV